MFFIHDDISRGKAAYLAQTWEKRLLSEQWYCYGEISQMPRPDPVKGPFYNVTLLLNYIILHRYFGISQI